ncbi:MAG: OmpA family protein [Bacteroidetes bacterium]|nr:OmpA family protein [Bacteroidota bacterium]
MKKYILFLFLILINLIALAQTKTIIYFDSNKSELKSNSITKLDSLTKFLNTTKDYQISINGYCDNTGTEIINQSLSEARADIIFNYFKSKNIPSQFFTTKGFAANNPISENTSEKGKAINRRTEILITINAPIMVNVLMENEVSQGPQKPDTITVKAKESFNSNSTINDLEIGKTLVLKNLNFEGGTAILLPEAEPTLKLLLKTMKSNVTLEIEIGGHVCCADDMPLSILRAKTVYKYLILNGIDQSRLKYKGYSRNKPIYEDDRNPFEAKANRRVEITVLKK